MRLPTSAILSAPLVLIALPATAQPLAETHQMRWAPAGKVPAAHFHPVRDTCRSIAAPTHLAGKTMMHGTSAATCKDQVAKVKVKEAAKVAAR